MDYAQSLYEKRLTTYPRTDSRYLTENMQEQIPYLTGSVAQALPVIVPHEVLCNSGQVIDGSKVSDHHAILPTLHIKQIVLDDLPAGERNLLTLIMIRLLCATHRPCRILETSVVLECEGHRFTAKGRQIVDRGWKALEQALHAALGSKLESEENEGERQLPVLNDQMTFLPVTASIREGATTPPRHYTEDTLLSAMETAGGANQPDDAERKGLGTPATRAGILEKLVKVGFVERKGTRKSVVLLPTRKAQSLITVLPEELQSPELTAEWEQKLGRIERGELNADIFLEEMTHRVRGLVAAAQPVKDSQVLFGEDRRVIGVCPRCGASVHKNRKGFVCANRACGFALWKNDRFFTSKRKELTASIAAVLLKEGRAELKGLYSEKTGRTYDAGVVLEDVDKPYANFKLSFEKN